jgi:hypothetical protein
MCAYDSDECIERELPPIAGQQPIEKLRLDADSFRCDSSIATVIVLDERTDPRRNVSA